MKNKIVFYIIPLLFALSCTSATETEMKTTFTHKEQMQETEALVKRVVPTHHDHFVVNIVAKSSDQQPDFFRLYNKGEKIVLEGNNGISVASALNYYLKNYCGCHISWNGENMELPTAMPSIEGVVEKETPHRYRYYLNYCTFNYTISWWDWERWQWEIDFMALNGINMPLALTGQNSVWQRVYRELGFTDKELESFFSGPAYFNWFWMGNLDGWGGPLPQSFIDKHEVLQKRILQRERVLGMTPILPAFTGHVPPMFSEKFPDIKVRKTDWVGFPEVSILDPSEDMFHTIGNLFITEQAKLYGTNHYYTADTFNENTPPTNDSIYLSDMSSRVYESMHSADADAIWLMQGWLFYHGREFWGDKEIEALLAPVPDDRMIILDLWSERFPVWSRTNAYHGKSWIWCMLHNFGQNNTFSGNIRNISENPANTLTDTQAGNYCGIGLTMEAIEQNPFVYAMMFENVWRDTPIDVSQFIVDYTTQRYGKQDENAIEAWSILSVTALEDTVTNGGPESIITGRPTFVKNPRGTTNTILPYSQDSLIQVWELMLTAADNLASSDGFRYDLVDVTRQVLANYALDIQQRAATAYDKQDLVAFKKEAQAFLALIQDLDTILATRDEFLLGNWLEAAKAVGTTPTESALYEHNARTLITTWGDKDSELADYSCRHWSGLMSNFYYQRWAQFFEAVESALANKKEFIYDDFVEQVKSWEWAWTNQQELYPTTPIGSEVETARAMYSKYKDRM